MAEQTKNGAVVPVPAHPASIIERMEHEFELLRRRAFGRGSTTPRLFGPTPRSETPWSPSVDACEYDGAIVIKADLPGVKPADVRVTVDAGYLTIEASREEGQETKDARYYAAERISGSFYRSLALPAGVDAAAVTATYKDGVLEVRVPCDKAVRQRAIDVPVRTS